MAASVAGSGMKVWIVRRSEDYEGGENKGVFSTREKAEEYMIRYVIQCNKLRSGSNRRFTCVNSDEWRSGCCSIVIEEETIDEQYMDDLS